MKKNNIYRPLTQEELKIIGISKDNVDGKYKRLSWDEYFLRLCILVSQRSHDAETQHGCVIVRNKLVIATGFNGYPAGSPDNILPNIRKDGWKYRFINHAEESAIFSAAKNGIKLDESSIYISGMPCFNCARRLISVGIKQWFIGNIGHQSNEIDDLTTKFWINHFKIKIKKINCTLIENFKK